MLHLYDMCDQWEQMTPQCLIERPCGSLNMHLPPTITTKEYCKYNAVNKVVAFLYRVTFLQFQNLNRSPTWTRRVVFFVITYLP